MTQWIAGIARGHNGGVCLLKDGEIVFAVEEERISRRKYDGAPLASMMLIKEYTDKLDYLVIAHGGRELAVCIQVVSIYSFFAPICTCCVGDLAQE